MSGEPLKDPAWPVALQRGAAADYFAEVINESTTRSRLAGANVNSSTEEGGEMACGAGVASPGFCVGGGLGRPVIGATMRMYGYAGERMLVESRG